MAMQVHSIGRKMPEEVSPAGDWLMALYSSMLNASRWQRKRGADFVFYDPHPGFADGSAEEPYHKLLCDDFQHAMHIVVERGQRNVCQVIACCLSSLPLGWCPYPSVVHAFLSQSQSAYAVAKTEALCRKGW